VAKLKQGKTHRELSVRLEDLLSEWLKKCETVQEIKDQLFKEQLLKPLPEEVCIYIQEGSWRRVNRLADNYVTAHKREEMKPPRPCRMKCKGVLPLSW